MKFKSIIKIAIEERQNEILNKSESFKIVINNIFYTFLINADYNEYFIFDSNYTDVPMIGSIKYTELLKLINLQKL